MPSPFFPFLKLNAFRLCSLWQDRALLPAGSRSLSSYHACKSTSIVSYNLETLAIRVSLVRVPGTLRLLLNYAPPIWAFATCLFEHKLAILLNWHMELHTDKSTASPSSLIFFLIMCHQSCITRTIKYKTGRRQHRPVGVIAIIIQLLIYCFV
jgi:hypothetical protein